MLKKFFCLALLLVATSAQAELRIDITQGQMDPIPTAIVDFTGSGDALSEVTQGMGQVISANLQRSGLFKPIDKAAFIQENLTVNTPPRYGDWRAINAQVLVVGSVTASPDGRTRVDFRLFDVFAEKQLAGMAYYTTPRNWRRIAHIISDAIYERITGEKGYFDTRIVYVAETGPAKKRIKRLAIMDQDGANQRYLTDGRSLVLTPRFSPSTAEVAYLSYARNTPRVYVLNVDTGQSRVVGQFPGMTFAPRYSADGQALVFSMAKDGNSDLYKMDMRTRRVTRLTNHPAIDTSPSYSPDGKQLTFNSDRGGTQQIYVMDADGDNVRRISRGEGRYGTPVWSPRGDLIAFTKMQGGEFFIGVMRTDGSGERLVSKSYLDEGPTWAPNGRVLMFFRQEPTRGKREGKTRLYAVDLTGYNMREVPTPTDASDPAWSPLLP